MKIARYGLILFFLIAFQVALAADRVSVVNSKIINSLNGILLSTDYLVIVNRLDMLEETGETEAVNDGTIKNLPGLTVGVDSKGNVVRQDSLGNHYNGPVSVVVLVDQNVKEETFKMIKESMNEIMGGARDLDEIKIKRSTLRQPLPQSASPVTVNNNMTTPVDSKDSMKENFRLAALLLMTAGLFAFLMGRFLSGGKDTASKSPLNALTSPGSPASSADAKKEGEKQEKFVDQIARIAPEVVGLYLIKCLKEKKTEHVNQWSRSTLASHQREVFLSLPAWVAAHLENRIDFSTVDMQSEGLPESNVKPEQLLREITVLETNLKSEHARAEAFLMWFPPQSLRMVPKRYQERFSDESRATLWTYRKELGEFVKAQVLSSADLVHEPTEGEVKACFEEMRIWPSSLFKNLDQKETDPVDIWSSIINQLSEFSAIDGQLKQAQERLSQDQYTALLKKICYVESPLMWDQTQIRSWLLVIDPQDYYWWTQLIQHQPTWDLGSLLRPMRKAMFDLARQNEAHQKWQEVDRKAASERLINQMRYVQLGYDMSSPEMVA